jgi:hypothetical protein
MRERSCGGGDIQGVSVLYAAAVCFWIPQFLAFLLERVELLFLVSVVVVVVYCWLEVSKDFLLGLLNNTVRYCVYVY